MDIVSYTQMVLLNIYNEIFLPVLLTAIKIAIVLIVAWVFEKFITWILRNAYTHLRISKRLEKYGLHDALFGITLEEIIEWLVKIYIYLFALAVAGDWSSFSVLTNWAIGAMGYMSLFIQGLVVVIVALFLADFIGDAIRRSEMLFAELLAMFVQGLIAFIGFLVALPSFVPSADTRVLIWSFVVLIGGLALGIGLGFGLAVGGGAKDYVAEYLATTLPKKVTKTKRRR